MWTKEGRLAVHRFTTGQLSLAQVSIMLALSVNSTPDADLQYTSIGTNFVESTFNGYARIVSPTWNTPTINGSGQAEGQSSLLTWTAGSGLLGPQTIAAIMYLMEDSLSNVYLAWLKRLSPTVTLGSPGEQYNAYIDLFTDDIAALD